VKELKRMESEEKEQRGRRKGGREEVLSKRGESRTQLLTQSEIITKKKK